jgi:malate dehydrogenase (oxaloacetate-decarboxylating)
VRVMATGRSDYPNQINYVLAFPGMFRGALDARATAINEAMKLAAAKGIASVVRDDEDRDVSQAVAQAVQEVAERTRPTTSDPEPPTVKRAAAP